VNRLRAAGSSDIVLITAPPGYGKTILLTDWEARDIRPFARVTITHRDTAATLAARLASAVGASLGTAGRGPMQIRPMTPEHAVVHVMRQLQTEASIVIACDDVDQLADPGAILLLDRLADELQPGSQLALVGRTCAAFPIPRWRVAGRLFELSTADLSFRDREAASLFRKLGVLLTVHQVETMNGGLEGWPAGLQLAARSPWSSSSTVKRLSRSTDEAMFDYLRQTIVTQMSARELRFLTRASVLHRLSAQLCDAVVGSRRSASMLERLERKNLFVTPLGRDRTWYRLHPAFRNVLARELEQREPELVRDLHRRAAAWCRAHGETELALEHASAARDVDSLADAIEHTPVPFLTGATPASVERWLSPIDDDAVLHARPAVAAVGALAWALTGRADSAIRWSSAANGTVAQSPLLPLTAPRDAHELLDATERAVHSLPPGSAWRPSLLALAGYARELDGDESADRVLEEAAGAAAAVGQVTVECMALARRSLLATQAEDWARADTLAAAAQGCIRANALDEHVTTVFAHAADARTALRHGDWSTVHRDLDRATTLLPRLTHALPVLAVSVRTELLHVLLALGDAAGARRLLDEIDEVYALEPRFGLFRDDVALLRRRYAEAERRAAVLTAAELRLLPLLTTHLSFREIAEQLYVSRNTVKTQAISVYRKLGVCSRGEAIDRASDLGLVPGNGRERHA
jgi:LuxR family maltose regulon positive regulatory protein